MANPIYANGKHWCRRGQHYVTDTDIRLATNGQKYCLEHKFQVRDRPRSKKYKAKYYDRLKTKITTYPNT